MSVASKAPPDLIRVHRAPLLDPPFDDELEAAVYRPLPALPPFVLPAAAVAGASPECHTAALRFLNFCLELFDGFRSPVQMRPVIALERGLEVLDELTRAMRLIYARRKRHPGLKLRRSQVRTCEPRPGVAEVTAVLTDGHRSFALCYRLERNPGQRWRCTDLEVLL